MSEFLVIQVGQCGNQIGSALWPQILDEYDISMTGKSKNHSHKQQDSISSFFHIPKGKFDGGVYESFQELVNDKFKARAICIDMEESVVNRFRTGPLRGLFDDKSLITNYPGSGNNWAEGFCEHGPLYQNEILNCLRHSVERCDSLHGFLMLFSTGGGTGSGVGTYVLNLLREFYPKIERIVSCVYSTGTEDVITSPYNNALATHQLLENATCVFPVENRCLLDIVSKKYINKKPQKIGRPKIVDSTSEMNDSIVEMLLHVTSGSRFSGSLNFDMNEISTNMVPYPGINFLSCGFNHCSNIIQISSKQAKEEMFSASYNRTNQLIKVDPLGPKSILLGATLIGRGDYTITDLQSYMEKLQSKAKFTSWSRKSVRVGLCDVAPTNRNVALFSMFNTTGMHNLFRYIDKQYCRLFTKKAHVHHYTKISNFELDFFQECKESLDNIVEKYRQLEVLTPVTIPRLRPTL